MFINSPKAKRSLIPFLSICIPTYGRQPNILFLWEQTLCPILSRFDDQVEVIIRDNSVELKDYDSELLVHVFEHINYALNPVNLGYHGSIMELYSSARGQYVWFWSDDDDYNLDACSSIIDMIIARRLDADLILPPFRYAQSASFRSTILIEEAISRTQNTVGQASVLSTNFGELLDAGVYPNMTLTSSVILKRVNSSIVEPIVAKYSDNAWIHEVLAIVSCKRDSLIQIPITAPYVSYHSHGDDGSPSTSYIDIGYIHRSMFDLAQLRSEVFASQSFYTPSTLWMTTILRLLQSKDESIKWSNTSRSVRHLIINGLTFSVMTLDLKLMLYIVAFVILPRPLVSRIRKSRQSDHHIPL